MKIAITTRAYNILKCTELLLENSHWEDAAILTRSLFELLLNIEEIMGEPEQSEKKAKRYFRFGYLQECLHMKANADYEIMRGTYKGDTEALKKLEATLPDAFPDFLDKNRGKNKTKRNWARTWCGKTVRHLAESSKNPIRIHQYKIMYSFTSNLIHSNAMALSGSSTFGTPYEMTQQNIIDRDKQKIGEYIILIISFVGEILLKTGDIYKGFDAHDLLDIQKKMKCEIYNF